MKQSKHVTVRVNGVGKTAQLAFANALGCVQRNILQNNNNILLRIEPLNTKLIEALVKKETERFLFFFLPRTKKKFFVVLDVECLVSFIDIDSIVFK